MDAERQKNDADAVAQAAQAKLKYLNEKELVAVVAKKAKEAKLQQAIKDANDITKNINKVNDMGNFMTLLAKPSKNYDPSTHKKNNLQHYNLKKNTNT